VDEPIGIEDVELKIAFVHDEMNIRPAGILSNSATEETEDQQNVWLSSSTDE
jgi:hypothetical protein